MAITKAAVTLTLAPIPRTEKHIDIKRYFIRAAYEDKHIAPEDTPTAEMTVDMLAKPLALHLHETMEWI